MPGRSLQLSKEGQQQARQALLVRSLTQKAIANELAIAAWSTVNKFFNGKPVDRFIFQEICEVLNLDWEDVVEGTGKKAKDTEKRDLQVFLPSHSAISHALHIAVQSQATAAREALNPRILERIPRTVVREKYLGAIARGVYEQKERLIAIIGPAGYGKSTLLGDIYDELLVAKTPWVGLVLCSSLSLSTGYPELMSYKLVTSTMAGSVPNGPAQNQQEMIAIALGQSVCGEPRSVTEVCQELTRTQGRGVLLIDTLDLIVNRDFVVAFGTLMRQVLAGGTTVVFTCRDHEYNDHLEPSRERLPGLAQAIDRHTVPNFTTAEIETASTAFFQRHFPMRPEQGVRFAQTILTLSADSRSLRDIVENPLLLALLCDLFAQEEQVPADLTVSKLYQRYWQEKVLYSRVDQSRFVPLASAKEHLCLEIAATLFRFSQDRLKESLYRDDLAVTFTKMLHKAYTDLLSEHVIEHLPSGQLHFFHQTLLEYAIAYWLTRQKAAEARAQWLSQLSQPPGVTAQTHWLPVLRQYLAITDESEFIHCLQTLSLEHLGVFSAVAYGATSRESSQALEHLLPLALTLGEAYQKRLWQALEAAPGQMAEGGWPILMALLQAGNHATAINTARTLSLLLARWWSRLGPRLPDAIAAITARSLSPTSQSHKGTDDRILLTGWLLHHCLPSMADQPDRALLQALHPYCSGLGQNTLAAIVQIHLGETVPLAIQQSLLKALEAAPLSGHVELGAAVTELLYTTCAPALDPQKADDWQSWHRKLVQPRRAGWDKAYARALGATAIDQPALLPDLLAATLPLTEAQPQPQYFRLYYMALEEHIKRGGGGAVIGRVIKQPPNRIHPVAFKPWIKFLRLMAATLTSADQDRIAQWLQPHLSDQKRLLLPLLDVLATASLRARHELAQLLDDIPTAERGRYQARLLQFQPIDQHPPLQTLDKQAQVVLVKFYRERAATEPAATQRLLTGCQSHFAEVALAASYGLTPEPLQGLTLEPVLSLLTSRFTGVQVNALGAISSLSQGGKTLSAPQLIGLCQQPSLLNNQAVVRPFCEFVAAWVKQHRQVPPDIVASLGNIPQRLQQQGTWDGGVARVLIAAFKAISQSQDPALDIQSLGSKIRYLLKAIDLIAVPHGESEMMDVLSALDRLDRGILGRIVEVDCPQLAERGWQRNLSTVIRTIRRVEGKDSNLLDHILQSTWCNADVASLVLEARGV